MLENKTMKTPSLVFLKFVCSDQSILKRPSFTFNILFLKSLLNYKSPSLALKKFHWLEETEVDVLD